MRAGDEEITKPFECFEPGEEQARRIERVRRACRSLHATLLTLTPCPERAIAITRLTEASMWAIKGIETAHQGPTELAHQGPTGLADNGLTQNRCVLTIPNGEEVIEVTESTNAPKTEE